MSDKLFKCFKSFYLGICSSIKEFISIVLDFETCTIYLAREVLSFTCVITCIRKISFPTPPHIPPRKIHTTFSLSEIIFYATSRIISSGTTYQEVFPSKRNLRGISHFSFLIIANTFNTVDLDINEHCNRL